MCLKFKEKIKDYRKQLRALKSKKDTKFIAQFEAILKKLGQILQQQEAYWKQRAKQFWLVEGDSNTRYFHQYASSRRKKNSIQKLKDEHQCWKTWDTGLKNLIISYFQDLFRSNGCASEEILNTVEIRVTMEQNNELS